MATKLAPPLVTFDPDAVKQSIPGLKTSTTFLSSLSANLRLADPSPFPSPASTPVNRPGTPPLSHGATITRSASPLALSCSALADSRPFVNHDRPQNGRERSPTNDSRNHNPYDLSIPPELEFVDVVDDTSKSSGLLLIADTVRRQQLSALHSLVTHPLNVAVFCLLLFLSDKCFRIPLPIVAADGRPLGTLSLPSYRHPFVQSVWILLFLTSAFVALAITWPYRWQATKIETDWLRSDEIMIVARKESSNPGSASAWTDLAANDASLAHGREIAGVVVVNWTTVLREGWHGRSKGAKKILRRAWIRAWAVRPEYRGRGVGRALLRKAMSVTASGAGGGGGGSAKSGDGICFVSDHANSERVLPDILGYNCFVDRIERRAYACLDSIISEGPWHTRKRSR